MRFVFVEAAIQVLVTFFFFFYVCGEESFFMPFAVLSSILLFVRYATCSLWLWSGPEMPVGLDQMRPASCVE